MTEEFFDVTSLECHEGHLLHLCFEDGQRRIFDMEPWFGRKPYQVLRSPSIFNQARVEYGTVVWPGEIDIDPETLRNGSMAIGSHDVCSPEFDTHPSLC